MSKNCSLGRTLILLQVVMYKIDGGGGFKNYYLGQTNPSLKKLPAFWVKITINKITTIMKRPNWSYKCYNNQFSERGKGRKNKHIYSVQCPPIDNMKSSMNKNNGTVIKTSKNIYSFME